MSSVSVSEGDMAYALIADTGVEIGTAGRTAVGPVVSIAKIAPVSRISEGVRPYALDAERAREPWSKTEEMVAARF